MCKMVSVIIPIYNAEKSLPQAIESVINQSYKNIELILVDDGSIDTSADICDKYACQDKRIKVIHKKNAGVSAARNSGLAISTGEYIVFLDADDTLDKDILERAVLSVKDKKTIYQWGYTLIFDKEKRPGPILVTHDLSKDEIMSIIIGWNIADINLGVFFRAVCGKLLFADIIKENKILFPESLYIGEDAIFLLKYSKYINTIQIVSNSGYNYRISDASAVGRYKSDLLAQYEQQIEILKDIQSQEHLDIVPAIVAFCYEGFHALINNSQKGYHLKKITKQEQYHDAKVWFKRHSCLMKQKKIQSSGMRKLHRLQYKISRFCPFIGQYYIVKFFLRRE